MQLNQAIEISDHVGANLSSAAQSPAATSAWRRWWAVALLILGLGLIPRLVGYNYQLPYLGYYDEPWLFWSSMSWRGVYPVQTTLPAYPPGILMVDGLAQFIVEQHTHDWTINHIGEAVALARLFSIVVNLMTALVIGLLAKRVAGQWAGWLAMALWLIPQQIIEHSIQAMPTPWIMLFSALALFWAILALDSDWVGFPLLSIAAALVSVTFKYTEAPMLIFGLIAGVNHLIKSWARPSRTVWSRVLLAQIGLIAGYAVWLIGVYHATDLFSYQLEASHAAQGNFWRIFVLQEHIRLATTALDQFGLTPLLFIAVAGVGSILFLARRRSVLAWLLIAAFTLGHIMDVAAYYYWSWLTPRYLLPTSIGLALLIAVALSEYGLRCVQYLPRRWPAPVAIIAVLFMLVWGLPQVQATAQFAQQRTRPDTRGAMQRWAKVNLEPQANVVVTRDFDKVFSREWAGYEGPTTISVWDPPLASRTLAEWMQASYRYAVLSDNQAQALRDEKPNYSAQLLILKRFPPPDISADWVGPQGSIFRLWPMQHAVSVDFGNVARLVGYDLGLSTRKPGDTIRFRPYWQSDKPPVDNFNVYVHVYPEDRIAIVAQSDGAPAGVQRPTLTWTDPGETVVGAEFLLTLPSDVQSGCYRLAIGMYNYETHQRLTVGSKDYATLKSFCVGAILF